MKHLSRKYKKRILRKNKISKKKIKPKKSVNRKSVKKSVNRKKTTTRKRRRVGGGDSDSEEDEEVAKYLIIKIRILRDPEFDEPIDAMIYMIIAGLGFAALENILVLFVLKQPDLIEKTILSK